MSDSPFDSWADAQTLAHIGASLRVPELPWPVLVRPIEGTAHEAVVSPWPYVSPCSALVLAGALATLKQHGFISFTAFLPPNANTDFDGWASVSVSLRILKQHYIWPRGCAPPAWSKKTRANVNRARRHWRVEEIEVAGFGPQVDELYSRRWTLPLKTAA
jgi:hypothetical protein